jgi:carnosine N-methyltransferase
LEHNEYVLRQLLGDFQYIMGLPSKSAGMVDGETQWRASSFESQYGMDHDPFSRHINYRIIDVASQRRKGSKCPPPLSTLPESETHSYDSAFQIFAHLVRDWTDEGSRIRHSLYDWCCLQVKRYAPYKARILVPGAGMGRLAYELYRQGHFVEANELSPSMAAAAYSIFDRKLSGFVHPYVLDVMANEVDSGRRYDMAFFPDVSLVSATREGGSLSYTVGNFVDSNKDNTYYHDFKGGYYDVVVTCFFIDTASNIYEYLGTITNILKAHSGIWINVGPVQWHQNAILRPSVDELKMTVEGLGWKLKSWSVDNDPLPYRDSGGNFVRNTNYDGYRPLRFVAIR